MAAKHTMSRSFDSDELAIISAIESALNEMGARDIQFANDRSRVSARIGFNLRSCGENLSVSVNTPGMVQITSKCVLPTQIIDWGKNKKNCNMFMKALSARM